jgi:hypothetical protein
VKEKTEVLSILCELVSELMICSSPFLSCCYIIICNLLLQVCTHTHTTYTSLLLTVSHMKVSLTHSLCSELVLRCISLYNVTSTQMFMHAHQKFKPSACTGMCPAHRKYFCNYRQECHHKYPNKSKKQV